MAVVRVKKFYLNKIFYLGPALGAIFIAAVLSYSGWAFVEAYTNNNLSSLNYIELLAGLSSPVLVPAVLYFTLPPLFMNTESLRFDEKGLHIREGALMKHFSWTEIVTFERDNLYAEVPFRFLIRKDCVKVEHAKTGAPGPIWLIPKKYNTTPEVLLSELKKFSAHIR